MSANGFISKALQIVEAVTAILVAHGVPTTEAKYRARWCISMYSRPDLDALTWNIATALWRAEGGTETRDLIQQSIWVRGKFVAMAHAALAETKSIGEGLSDSMYMAQSRASYLAHQAQVDEQRRNTAHEQVVSAESDRGQR